MYIRIYTGAQLLQLLEQENITKFSVKSCDLILKSYSEDTDFDADMIAEDWIESTTKEIYDRYKNLRNFYFIDPDTEDTFAQTLKVLQSYTIAYASMNKYSEPVILYKLF